MSDHQALIEDDWADHLRSIHIPDSDMPHLCQICGAEDGAYPCSTLEYINTDLVQERAAWKAETTRLCDVLAAAERRGAESEAATKYFTGLLDTVGKEASRQVAALEQRAARAEAERGELKAAIDAAWATTQATLARQPDAEAPV